MPGQSEEVALGEGEEVKLEERCLLLLVAFLISVNKGVWEPQSWLNSQETPGEDLFVLKKIQEQQPKNPSPQSAQEAGR